MIKKTIVIISVMMVLLVVSVISVGETHYWTTDDNTTMIDSIGTWNGTEHSGVELLNSTYCIVGSCYNVSGTGFYNFGDVDFPDNDNFTYSLWIYFHDTTANQGVIAKSWSGRDYLLDIETNDHMRTLMGDGTTFQTSLEAGLIGSWNYYTWSIEVGNASFFINGLVRNSTNMSGYADSNQDMCFFAEECSGATGNVPMNARADEAKAWDRALSASEVLVEFDSYAPVIPISSNIDLLFDNVTDRTLYKTLFGEGENFYVNINWTNATIPINDSFGTCNISLVNGITEDESIITNFTMCSNGCDNDTITEELTFDADNTTQEVLEDFVNVRACHLNNPIRDLEVTFECAGLIDIQILSSAEIPSCLFDFENIFVNSSICRGHISVNITLDNDASNINSAHLIDTWELDREFVEHFNSPPDVIFNATTNLWQTAHNHEYYSRGLHLINANCTHNTESNATNSTSEFIEIVNEPPMIEILGFVLPNGSFSSFNDSILVEYQNGTYRLIINIIDSDLSSFYVNVSNSTDAKFTAFTNLINMTMNSTLFLDFLENPFNISVFANDSSSNVTRDSLLINFTSTTFPTIIYNSPVISNDSIFTIDIIDISVTCIADNLFSIQHNITDCGSTILFNVTNESLSGLTQFEFSDSYNFTNLSDGNYCSVTRLCNGHTKVLINKYLTKFNTTSNTMLYNDEIKIKVNSPVEYFKTELNFDRYDFNIKTLSKTDYLEFEVNSLEEIHLIKSKWKGHLITGKYWIDFETEDIKNIEIERINKFKVIIKITFNNVRDIFRFSSIGELNCRVTVAEFTVNRIPPFEFRLNNINLSLEGIAFIFLLFLIGAGLIIYAEYIMSIVLIITSGIYILLYGLFMLVISPPFAIVLLFVGLIIILRGIENLITIKGD